MESSSVEPEMTPLRNAVSNPGHAPEHPVPNDQAALSLAEEALLEVGLEEHQQPAV